MGILDINIPWMTKLLGGVPTNANLAAGPMVSTDPFFGTRARVGNVGSALVDLPGLLGTTPGMVNMPTAAQSKTGLGGIFSNKLFLQYLSGVGSALNEGKPVGPALNQITVQNIAAQNKAKLNQTYMNMMRKLLASGGKVDQKGLTIPHEALSDPLSGDAGVNELIPTAPSSTGGTSPVYGDSTRSPSSGVSPNQLSPINQEVLRLINPSTPAISGADLAGLSTEDISQALGSALGVGRLEMDWEQMKDKKISDVATALYQDTLRREAETRIAEKDRVYTTEEGIELDRDQYLRYLPLQKEAALDKDYPVPLYGVGIVSMREWSAASQDERSYSLYLHAVRERNKNLRPPRLPEEPMSKDEFDMRKPTEREKLLRALQADPALLAVEKQLNESKATKISIEDKTATARALKDVESEKYITSAEFASAINKHMDSDLVRSFLLQYAGKPGLVEARETLRIKKRFIESTIISLGGKITSLVADGDTLVWTIRWPSGYSSEYRHASK